MYVAYKPASEAHKKKQKQKARELRQSRWWKQKLDDGICYYCGQKFPPSEITMDHKVPVARGGMSSRGNIVACCKACNSAKKNQTASELVSAGAGQK